MASEIKHLKLSEAQKEFLRGFTNGGFMMPPSGSQAAGRAASNYYRTARVLEEKGLVVAGSSHYARYLTLRGLAVAVYLLTHPEA